MEPSTADLRRAYDSDAERRDGRDPEPWRLDIVDGLAARVCAMQARAGGMRPRVLDLGCGAGQLAQHLGNHDLEVVGVDLSAAMVGRARARGVEAFIGGFDRLPFAAATFDGALAFNSFVHTPRSGLGEVFTEVRRVLVPGAPLTVVLWGGETREGPMDRDWLDPPRYFSLLSDADLLELPTPGFVRLEVRLLHEQANPDLHPQVLTLAASTGPRSRDDR